MLGRRVALNCAANTTIADPVFVPPVPNDAGVAVGAAWSVAKPSTKRVIDPFLGSPGGYAVPSALDVGSNLTDLQKVAERILDGAVCGIYEDRPEVGPRALGHRSVVSLARPRAVSDAINKRKGRELWRPLAPVMFDRFSRNYLNAAERDTRSLYRYMAAAPRVSDWAYDNAPASVHIDGTARIQTLGDDDHGLLARILAEIEAAGGPPVLINTSLNIAGQPIVQTLAEATELLRLGVCDFLVTPDMTLSGLW